ncbi:IS3 family transposase [Nocardia gipuzkoensis]
MYGRREMTRYLRRHGHDVAFCTVDRLMRELGMNRAVRGRKQRTTIPVKDGVRTADNLNRDFTATEPNLVWVADFTYVSTWTGRGRADEDLPRLHVTGFHCRPRPCRRSIRKRSRKSSTISTCGTAPGSVDSCPVRIPPRWKDVHHAEAVSRGVPPRCSRGRP